MLELDKTLVTGAPSRDTNVKIKGDDTALGFNIGVLVQATDTTRVGLTYHSKVNYKLEGHTTRQRPGAGLQGSCVSNRYDASLKIEHSGIVRPVGHSRPGLTPGNSYAGTTWTRWSRLKEITVNNEGVTGADGGSLAPSRIGTITEEQNWHDTWAYAVGTSYQLTKQVGTAYRPDLRPVANQQPADRSPRIPTGDRTIFSLGLGYAVMDNMTIDLAYSYLKEEDVKVNNAAAAVELPRQVRKQCQRFRPGHDLQVLIQSTAHKKAPLSCKGGGAF